MLLVVSELRLSLLSHSVLPVTLMVNWRPCGPCTTKDCAVVLTLTTAASNSSM